MAMPTHSTQLPPLDPLADARALQASIVALRLLLAAQSRQFEIIERRFVPAGTPAEMGTRRLRVLKTKGF
jgi:hypothetical protein